MTEEEKRVSKYKDYPEGSVRKRVYDSVFLPFQEYLNKYYNQLDLNTWKRWQQKYIEPYFDESRHEEMIKNFGYVSINRHDFKIQYAMYDKLKDDNRLDDEIKKFISFMAGVGFFKQYAINLEEWFKIENWGNTASKLEDWKRRTINDVLSYEYGINFLKSDLPHISFWKR